MIHLSEVKRLPTRSPECRERGLDSLVQALLSLRTAEQLRAMLIDLCTPAEIEALSDRWQVVAPLLQGVPYRDI